MKATSLPICALTCLLAWCGAAAAQGKDTVYRSVGPDGKVTYSQTPPGGGTVDRKLEFQQLPASPLPAHVLKFREEMERNGKARDTAAATPPANGLRLFSAVWCGYCKLAKAWLARNGTAYQELDIDTPAGMKAFIQAGSKGSVPLLVGPGIRLQGFADAAYATALAKPLR